jgi:hypothetical protein
MREYKFIGYNLASHSDRAIAENHINKYTALGWDIFESKIKDDLSFIQIILYRDVVSYAEEDEKIPVEV